MIKEFNNWVKKKKNLDKVKIFAGLLIALSLDRKSVVQGKSVDLGGRRISKKKKKQVVKREKKNMSEEDNDIRWENNRERSQLRRK